MKYNSSYLLQAHIIFVTKYSQRKFNAMMLDKMKIMIDRECLKLKSTLVAFTGEPHHVHMIVSYLPSLSISRLVNILKRMTGREMKQWFPQLNQVAWRKILCAVLDILPAQLEGHQLRCLNSILSNNKGRIRLLRNLGYPRITHSKRWGFSPI